MSLSGVMQIAIAELRPLAERETTLEARLRATMREAHDHWLVTDEDERMRCAIGAVLLVSDADDQDRIRRELEALRMMNMAIGAAQAGVPVDWESMTMPEPDATGWIGLMRLWQETR